ncbi:MAG: hypothetical protein LLG06_12910 [Desulfobacteraceae bacterium]|nr:hypothetical protein [Desulfobacteraceae bacterium]
MHGLLKRLVSRALRAAGIPILDGLKAGGVFTVECFDAAGNLKWRDTAENLVVNAGLNHLLDVVFHAATQITTWYVGLVGASPTYAAGDILASHSGWTEFPSYTGNRQEFNEGAASSQQISNSGNAASFAITGSGTVAGAFICSVNTGTSGTLFCAASFSQGAKSVSNGDTVNVTYTLSAADDGA